MQMSATSGDSSSPTRFTLSSALVLALGASLIAFVGLFAWTQLTAPSDGVHFVVEFSALRPEGVVVDVRDDHVGGVESDDMVVAVEGRPLDSWMSDFSGPWAERRRWEIGQTLTYTVERDGETSDVNVTLQGYPLGSFLAANWGAVLGGAVLVAVGTFVFARRPDDPAARAVFLLGASGVASSIWPIGLHVIDLTRGFEFAAYLAVTSFAYFFVVAVALHFWLVYPTPSQFVKARPWLIPAIYGTPFAAAGLSAVLTVLDEGLLEWMLGQQTTHTLIPLAYMVLTVIAAIWRYRTAVEPVSRRQVRWVVFAFAGSLTLVLALGIFPEAVLGEPLIPWNLQGLFALPVVLAMAIGVLKYRLFDIEPTVNRTFVYGGLTALVIVIYVMIVGAAGVFFQGADNLLVSLIAVGVVALLFQPLRERLQGLINRTIYGHRDDPYAVLSELGERLETTLAPDAALKSVADTVGKAFQAPYAALELFLDGRPEVVASHGQAGPDTTAVPIAFQGEELGRLVIAPREPGDHYSASDRRLLEDLARQAGVLIHNMRLTADLQRSRERLVSTREEERRRLRRDLHDGLGSVLAGFALKLDATRNLVTDDPPSAQRSMDELKKQTQSAISDIRQLVHDLRPPSLDELGLVHAIREYATQLNGARMQDGAVAANGLDVSVRAPEKLPQLPAAVEVAAYRIVLEAITNVVRHSGSRTCSIRLTVKDEKALELEVTDDGIGVNVNGKRGVGMMSMTERAEELGGSCTIEPISPRGTRVLAVLPLEKSHGLDNHDNGR